MKKVFVLTLFCAFFVDVVNAQSAIHSWKMGPLTWNDFSQNTAIGSKNSHLEYYMGIQGSVNVSGGVKYLYPAVNAFMSPEFSWADPHYRTPQLLAYHQCAFDLVEVHRRKLENFIMDGQAGFLDMIDPDRMIDNTMRQIEEDIARLEGETRGGHDSVCLSQWQSLVRRQLDSIPVHSFASHCDAPTRWGISFDVGYSYIGGELHDYLGGGFAMGCTGDIGIRRHFITMSLTMGGSRCTQQMLHVSHNINNLYPTDMVHHIDFCMAYGYAVVDKARLRLTPFVGYGWQQFYYNDLDAVSHGPTDGCLHVGLDCHYNFSNQVEVNEFMLRQQYNALHSLSSFHTKLFATYHRFESVIGVPTGFTVNLQLGIGLMTGRARCE